MLAGERRNSRHPEGGALRRLPKIAPQGPMIIDSNGDLVWFLDLSPGSDAGWRAFNFQVQSLAGEPVLTWFQGAAVDGHGQGHYELWGSGYAKVAEVTAKNGYQGDLHEFS
jgi:hypothetical protein